MDVIDRAIEKELHITGDEELNSQTWEQFRRNCIDKKVFLFGLGSAGAFFIANYNADVHLEGVIDNDPRKHNFQVGDFVAEAIDTQYEQLTISDITVLNNYTNEEITVLITSTNFYKQIVEQLKQYGIENYYLLLMMEANKRKKDESGSRQSELQIQEAYIEECCKQEINRKKIVVHIGNYGGHGKYITEQLLIQQPDLDIVWIVNDLSVSSPGKVRLIYEKNWKKYICEMETAHIWVYDIIVPVYIRKRSGQIYIQVKHWSSITLKKFFLEDLSTTCTQEEIDKVRHNGEIMDYIMTGSRFDEESCRNGFGFYGEFIRVGSPRSDALFCQNNRTKVFERYQIDSIANCVLYAPTFRYVKSEQRKFFRIELDFNMLREALEKRFGGEWYIFLRLHPSIAKMGKQVKQDSHVIDVCDYSDSQELIAAADITISDYSSIMFEPAFVQKPVFLYAPDLKDYVNKERDLLIDYNTLPFPIAQSNAELVKNIEQFNQKIYQHQLEKFLAKYEIYEDGHASERAAEFILELIDNG